MSTHNTTSSTRARRITCVGREGRAICWMIKPAQPRNATIENALPCS